LPVAKRVVGQPDQQPGPVHRPCTESF
jgi:hypothetical protein